MVVAQIVNMSSYELFSYICMIQLLGSSEMCPCRIPDAWHRPMWDFYKEYKSKADPSSRNNTIGLNNYLSNKIK